MELFFGEGFWSIFGAIIGAFLGALFGFTTTICIDWRRNIKLKRAFYEEADFLSKNVSDFLIAVVSEYGKRKIDIAKGEGFSGPIEIDFNLFNTLHLELYKTKSIPTEDHRRFVHNVSLRWENICTSDEERVQQVEDSSIYRVSRVKCLEIVDSTVELLYYFDLFVSKKGKFKFNSSLSFKDMVEVVFTKYQIENENLINEVQRRC